MKLSKIAETKNFNSATLYKVNGGWEGRIFTGKYNEELKIYYKKLKFDVLVKFRQVYACIVFNKKNSHGHECYINLYRPKEPIIENPKTNSKTQQDIIGVLKQAKRYNEISYGGLHPYIQDNNDYQDHNNYIDILISKVESARFK